MALTQGIMAQKNRHITFRKIHPLGIIACAFALVACGPDVQLVEEGREKYHMYWDDGHERYFRHGSYQSFYESGRVRSAGKYEHDVKVGVWTHWYENGQKQGEMDWVDGKPEGVVAEWYENGQLKNAGTWENGGRHGLSTWWYANGVKQKEVTYLNGEPDGVWTYWDSTGAVAKRQFWDRGAFLRVEMSDPP